MEPADVLLERPFPRDRHRQEESIKTCVVESLTDVAARCHDQPSLGVRNPCQSFSGGAPLLFSHPTSKDKYLLGHSCQPRREVLDVLCAASQKKWAPPRLDRPRDVGRDRLITSGVVDERRIDILDCGLGVVG